MLKAFRNALFLTVLFVLCALGQAGAFHCERGMEPQDHTFVAMPNSPAVLAMEFRTDAEAHGVVKGLAIIAEVESSEEDENRLEPSTLHHHKHYITIANEHRSGMETQRSAMLTASVNPAYLAAALPAFVRFQVFRI